MTQKSAVLPSPIPFPVSYLQDEQKNRLAFDSVPTLDWQRTKRRRSQSESQGTLDSDYAQALCGRLCSHISPRVVGVGSSVDPDYLNAMRDLDDYRALAQDSGAQEEMQNMVLWSDAINLINSETSGGPRGEHFLKLESAILPQPEKKPEQNYQACVNSKPASKDSEEYAAHKHGFTMKGTYELVEVAL
jgi:hypothetical protein